MSFSFLLEMKTNADYLCFSGTFNTLDFTKSGTIPARFVNTIKKISKELELPLAIAVTGKERQILLKVCQGTTHSDIGAIIQSIPIVPQSGTLTYLLIALSKL